MAKNDDDHYGSAVRPAGCSSRHRQSPARGEAYRRGTCSRHIQRRLILSVGRSHSCNASDEQNLRQNTTVLPVWGLVGGGRRWDGWVLSRSTRPRLHPTGGGARGI